MSFGGWVAGIGAGSICVGLLILFVASAGPTGAVANATGVASPLLGWAAGLLLFGVLLIVVGIASAALGGE